LFQYCTKQKRCEHNGLYVFLSAKTDDWDKEEDKRMMKDKTEYFGDHILLLIMSNQSSQKTILYEQRNVSECIYRV
jgi:hypothetical protein